MNDQRGIIRLEADGFARWEQRRRWWRWSEPKRVFQLKWDQIDRIIAYKDDLFAYDLIGLGFFIDGNTSKYLWVDEQMGGWNELSSQLHDRFRIPAGWYTAIMVPGFERCERTLWDRKAAFQP